MSRKTCERLPLTDSTKRRLWSEAGGYCTNPECEVVLFDDNADVDFAEMAHIIAASTGGPRDVAVSQLSPEARAHHSNVVVLCANCHRKVDKAPDVYPIELLQQWKVRHQESLQRAFGTPEFKTRDACRAFITPLLEENRVIFIQYGPVAGNFSEARATQWRRHVVSTIVPNNATIGRVLKQNRSLLGPQERRIADLFALHVMEFAARHLFRDWGAESTRFPDGMGSILTGEAV
ncbi:HNH endonuclease [Dactylosporangium sp. NPDC048998]|uniref:HNH endonuclease n=1 Tax=Dactylosporangium sp. NPDC048998 TaxID=3363976 RepID=UPI003721261B